jgi:hypothetical protein
MWLFNYLKFVVMAGLFLIFVIVVALVDMMSAYVDSMISNNRLKNNNLSND